jgi:hypothetical protein
MTDLIKTPIFLDETKARDWLEARVWANGRVCPHRGNADQDKITTLDGEAHRPGVCQCNEPACRQHILAHQIMSAASDLAILASESPRIRRGLA